MTFTEFQQSARGSAWTNCAWCGNYPFIQLCSCPNPGPAAPVSPQASSTHPGPVPAGGGGAAAAVGAGQLLLPAATLPVPTAALARALQRERGIQCPGCSWNAPAPASCGISRTGTPPSCPLSHFAAGPASQNNFLPNIQNKILLTYRSIFRIYGISIFSYPVPDSR